MILKSSGKKLCAEEEEYEESSLSEIDQNVIPEKNDNGEGSKEINSHSELLKTKQDV